MIRSWIRTVTVIGKDPHQSTPYSHPEVAVNHSPKSPGGPGFTSRLSHPVSWPPFPILLPAGCSRLMPPAQGSCHTVCPPCVPPASPLRPLTSLLPPRPSSQMKRSPLLQPILPSAWSPQCPLMALTLTPGSSRTAPPPDSPLLLPYPLGHVPSLSLTPDPGLSPYKMSH